jgi:hypothetical protein
MNITDRIRSLEFCRSAIPDRTGPHEVGTTTLRLPLAVDSGRPRSVRIQLWYPAEGTSGAGRSTFSDGWLSKLRHPTWVPARHNAPLAAARPKYPLIIYVPNMPGRHDDNTFTLANLASHGFILTAIDHPYREARLHIGSPHANGHSGSSDVADPAAALCERRIHRGVKTASALLDSLHELTAEGPGGAWVGRLDLDRVGILGYAVGGGVAAASTLLDHRYVAAANLDGTLCRETQPVTVPYLLMLSDFSLPAKGAAKDRVLSHTFEPASRAGEYKRALCQSALPESYVIEIAGTRREHFSDRLIFPSRLWDRQNRLPTYKRIRAIIDSYTVAFFRTYLHGQPHPLMCVRHSPYPEVRFLTDTEEPWAPTHRKSARN